MGKREALFPPKKTKNSQELKQENRDDYFYSQLSSRLSSQLQTSTIHLPHVKHAQRFSVTTHCGTFAAYHRTLLKWTTHTVHTPLGGAMRLR